MIVETRHGTSLQHFLDFQQFLPNLRQRCNDGGGFRFFHEIVLDGGFRALERVALHFREILDGAQDGDVVFGIETVAFLVFAWFDHVEFLLPEAQGGGGNTQSLSGFADAVPDFLLPGDGFGQRVGDGGVLVHEGLFFVGTTAALVALLDAFAFVVHFLTFRQADVEFGIAVFVDPKQGGDDGIAAFIELGHQFAHLLALEQQFAVSLGLVVVVAALRIFADMHVVNP